ncbi:C2H2 type zinc finger domain protein [Pleurostoma richardsiae]|uniref:C2H2 type zinc finger domain protein n=1 Tax=Pleurostoma richardsiae TaxID=41990 RepID=A0AA38S4E0_9PEZI|nr:C2H2 type zinc finger domain protein [Pleurostoma richardsiae]
MASPARSARHGEASAEDNAPSTVLTPHECPVCEKRFERVDHLKRHVASHLNTRDHVCPKCMRRFNRRDLLSRHMANHDSVNGSSSNRPRGPDRATQACEACVHAKTKCSNQRPCRRCQLRRVECKDGTSTRMSRTAPVRECLTGEVIEAASTMADSTQAIDEVHEHPPLGHVSLTDACSTMLQPQMSLDLIQRVLNNYPPHMNSGSGQFVSPITSAKDPLHNEVMGESLVQGINWESFNLLPADLFHMSQDLDFQFDDTLQSLCSDPILTTPAVDRQNLSDPEMSNVVDASPTASTRSLPKRRLTDVVIPGYEAYQKSPWLWTPVNQDHAYAEGQELSVDEVQLMQSPEVGQATPQASLVPRLMDAMSRDEILSLAVKFSKSHLKIRSFPSFKLLNVLMQGFFVREQASIDPWIHAGTFDPDRCRSELLAGIVAYGSTLFAAPKIWKMGLALQEVVKLAVCDAVDEDNQLCRDLQVNQAFLIWMEIGLWSGFRRKMEIGEGFANVITTMLRRAGAFRQSHYAPSPPPDITENGEELKQKWLRWVQQESFKRLVLHLFINEMRGSMAFGRNPVLSVAELSFTLPAARDLWDARGPEEWRARHLAKLHKHSSFTIIDGMHDPTQLEAEIDGIDIGLSSLAILYGFWSRVWSFTDSKTFTYQRKVTSNRSSTGFWVEAQRQELYQTIHTASLKLRSLHCLSPEGHLVSEFLMMSLHTLFEDTQRLVGRYGEEEFKQALPRLREWTQSDDQHCAAWHAGQVLRAARTFYPTQLRGFHAVAVYQACLTLFIFIVLSKISLASAPASPVPERSIVSNILRRGTDTSAAARPGGVLAAPHGRNIPLEILLDGEETIDVRTFLKTGHGRPRLTVSGEPQDLEDPRIVHTVMAEIFQSNFPSKSDPLPPLLENLASLMSDICKAFSV